MKKLAILLILLIIVKVNFSQVVFDLKLQKTEIPELEWKYSLPAPVYSSPEIQNNAVYFGCLDSNFYALDLASGKLFWSYKTGGQIRSTATIHANMLYFTSGDGNLYCLDLNGKLTWKFAARIDKQYDFADYFQSSPVISDGYVVFTSAEGSVYCLKFCP
jgi:outer membrane protein assembly factor BamB